MVIIPHCASITPYAVFAASTFVYSAVCAECSLFSMWVFFILKNGARVQISHHIIENYLSYKGVEDNCSKNISDIKKILNDPVNEQIHNSPTSPSCKYSPPVSFLETNIITSINPESEMKRTLVQIRTRLRRVLNFELFSLMWAKSSRIIGRVDIIFVCHLQLINVIIEFLYLLQLIIQMKSRTKSTR